MRPECIDAVNKAAGRTLSKEELDGIDSRMLGALRSLSRTRPEEFSGMTPAERVGRAAQIAKQQMIEASVRQHENAVEHVAKVAQLAEFRNQFEPGLQGRVAAVMQQAFHRAGAWIGNTSVEKNREAVLSHYIAQLDDVSHFGQKGWGFTMDLTKQQALMRELYGERSGDAEAEKYAGQIKDVLTRMNQHASLSNVDVHELSGWNAPQPTDWTKIGGDSDAWVKANIDRVDPNAYVNPDGTRQNREQLEATLREVHETLSTNGANARADEPQTGFSSSLGNKRNKPRELFFKDAQSYIDYMHDYGSSNNVYSMVRSVVHRTATDIALSDTYGRQAEKNFQQHIEAAFVDDRKTLTKEGDLRKLQAMKTTAERQFDVLLHGEGTGNALWANRMANARAYVSATKLGGGILSALTDPGMVMLNARVNGISEIKALSNTIRAAFPGKMQRAAADAGLLVHGIQAANNRFGLEDLGGRVPRFMGQMVHHLSGLSVLDSGIRGGIGLSMMDALGRITRSADFEGAKGDHAYLLNAHGVDQRIWDVWHAAEPDRGPDGSNTLLTPKSIYAIPDERLRPAVEQRIAEKSDVFREGLEKAQKRTEQENEWVEKRLQKFIDTRDAAMQTLDKYAERRGSETDAARARADAQSQVLRAAIQRAEVEHDIGAYLKTKDITGQIGGFLRDVENGASTERNAIKRRVYADNLPDASVDQFTKGAGIRERAEAAVTRYGTRINSAGEKLGARRAQAEEGIRQAQVRAAEVEKQNAQAVEQGRDTLDRKMRTKVQELNDFVDEVENRNARRAEYAAEYQRQIGSVADKEIQRARTDAAMKLLSTVLTEQQVGARGASTQTVGDKDAMGLLKNEKGTFSGELFRTLLHLKSVPVGILRQHWQESAGLGNPNMTKIDPRFGNMRSTWSYRARYLAYSMVLGALSYQLKTMVRGENPEDMTSPDFALKAAVSGGGFGMYGDLLLQDPTTKAQDLGAFALGPAGGTVNDAYKIYTSALHDQATQGRYNYGSHLLSFVRSDLTPMMNIWYLKSAFNHSIYQQLQNTLNPGWATRAANQAARQGKSFWWAPGDAAPSGPPNMSAAVGAG